MRTTHTHEVSASDVSADYSSYRKCFSIAITETVGDTTNRVDIKLTPAQIQDLMRQGRNALIDAKVIRGKRKYS